VVMPSRVVNSKSLKQNISQRNKSVNLTVLPNNIEYEYYINQHKKDAIRRQYGLSDKHFIITTAAPLNRVKNIGFLIEAFSQLEFSAARLLIIGDDIKNTGERKRLEKLSTKLGVAAKTVFTGWLDNPCDSIASADLFVFPSFQEGSPNALLEALSCNIACLGSRIPEIIEILYYEELLFSLSSTSELSQKIHKAIIDAKNREKISTLSNERKKAFVFDWKALAVNMITQAGQRMQ
jgi:glycosyltransferase involved in cell wall biosynthesis